MFIFFGTLFKTNEDYFIFQLKDSNLVLNYINNSIKEDDPIQPLEKNDIFNGKLCLYIKDESYRDVKRVILKKVDDSKNVMCEYLDDYVTTYISIDKIDKINKIFEIPPHLASIEPQILKCKLAESDISSDFLNQLSLYNEGNKNNSSNGIVKIQVDRVDQNQFYYLKAITVIYATSRNNNNGSSNLSRNNTSNLSTNNNTSNLCANNITSNLSSGSFSSVNDSICRGLEESYNESKNFGFDFDYPEVSTTNTVSTTINTIPVSGSNKKIGKKTLTKQQINKTKMQLTTKFTQEAKYRPYGVLVLESNNSHNKKLAIPKCIRIETASDHYVRCIAKLRLSLDSHFSQLLSFDKIISGRNVSLIGPVKSGLSTALAFGLSYRMYTQLISGQLPTNKLHAIILIKNAASGRYLEKFFATIFNTKHHTTTLKILFVDEISAKKSSANIITANIIIGSVRCILDALSQQFIVLTDLKCVLIDDAHVILRHHAADCQELFNQIKQIEDQSNLWNMLPHSKNSIDSIDSLSLKDTINNKIISEGGGVQIISNSHKWNLQLKSFQEAFVENPLLYIIDPIEMLSYLLPCPYVTQIIYHSNTSSLKSHCLKWINNHLSRSNLLIFTRTALECEMVYEMCNSNSINALHGTGFIDPGKIHDINTVWCATRDSTLRYVFVVSDCALLKVTISDAIYTYHYTLPYTKSDLRNRLGCSLSFYQNIIHKTVSVNNLTNDNQFMAVCPSYDCSNFLYCYKHLTANCDKASIGAAINNFYKSKFYTKEYELCDQLCPNIKLYGVCPVDKVFCKHSHLPWIINLNDHAIHRGSVSFTVSSVRCCTQLFGIVEQFSTGNSLLDKQLNANIGKNRIRLLNDLTFDMQLDNEKEQIKFSPSLLKNTCIYCCRDQSGAYYRCKLMDECVENDNLLNVYCIDKGLTKIVNKNDVFKLPESFQSIQPLVYEFIFTNFIPIDLIYGWPNHLNIQVSEAIIGKTVNAHIRYGFDNIIWIDSLVQKSKIENMKGNVVNFSLKHFLKKSTHCQPSEQLNKYVDQLDYSTYQYERKSSGHFKNFIGSTIDVCKVKSLRRATVCELTSVDFHVNHCNNDKIKESINSQIESVVNKFTSNQRLQHYRINDLCLARFPDHIWYRARITQFNNHSIDTSNEYIKDCTYSVYMIDIGEECDAQTLDNLIPVSKSHPLVKPPGLAIRCTLVDADFDDLNEDQLEDVFDYFDNLSEVLHVQYVCQGLHTQPEQCPELSHWAQCYYHVDGTPNDEFYNVLLDLYVYYAVRPSDLMSQMLYNLFSDVIGANVNEKNEDGIKKFTDEQWEKFMRKAEVESYIFDKLKAFFTKRFDSSDILDESTDVKSEGDTVEESKIMNEDGDIMNEDGDNMNQDGDIMNEDRDIMNQDGDIINEDGDIINKDGDIINEVGDIMNEDRDTMKEEDTKEEDIVNKVSAEKPDRINQAPKCVKWYETSDDFIKIRVLTNDPTDISVDIHQDYLALKFNDAFDGCDIDLKLYSQVKPKTLLVKRTSRCLYISVEKQSSIEWNNLFGTKTKFRWIMYDFDNVTDEEPPIKIKSDQNNIDWSTVLPNKEIKPWKNSSVEFRLPEDDDHFEPTSSESSDLEGFESAVEDHDIG